MGDPTKIAQMVDSPLMKAMLEDPVKMQEMMESNPQTKAMLDTNPEMRQAFSDPEMLKMSMQAMKNPSIMREAMRTQLTPRPPLQAATIAKQVFPSNVVFFFAFLLCLFIVAGLASCMRRSQKADD